MITIKQAYEIATANFDTISCVFSGFIEYKSFWLFGQFDREYLDFCVGDGFYTINKLDGKVTSYGSGEVPEFDRKYRKTYIGEVPDEKLKELMPPEDYELLLKFREKYPEDEDDDEEEE